MPSKGIVYYTDGILDPLIYKACRRQLERLMNEGSFTKIVSVGIGNVQPDFGIWNILDLPRSPLTMFKQILSGLETIDTDIVYLCEHDVLYGPSHFTIATDNPDIVLYNQNVWKVDSKTGHALHYPCSQVSGLSAYRKLLIDHYTKRVQMVEGNGFSLKMGYEPGTHGRPERVDDLESETWMSPTPNIDIRHTTNLSPTRWSKDQFRNPKYTLSWTEGSSVPGWGQTEGRFSDFLKDLT